MPIYHFNVEDGASVPDEEGCELPDLDTAKRAAMVLAGEMIREQSAGFWERPDWRVFVTDAAGQPLCTLNFTGGRRADADARDQREIRALRSTRQVSDAGWGVARRWQPAPALQGWWTGAGPTRRSSCRPSHSREGMSGACR